MLLLEKEKSYSIGNTRKIMVISQRKEVLETISQSLRVNGIDHVDEINSDFFTDAKLSFSSEEIAGIILDVKNVETSQIQSTINAIHGLIPQNIWCCVVGNNDSISVAQQFVEQGIHYFHLASQLEQIVKQVVEGVSTPNVRTSVNIHILGCKGGIGASFISSHVANLIADKKKVPVLLAQSETGTADLDLLLGKRVLPNTIAEYDENLRLIIGDTDKFKEDFLRKFNFIIHDLPIFNKKKEEYSSILEQGSNFVLVIERKLSSIRVAKRFLDEYKQIQQTAPKPRRVFVCINDHRPELARLMAVADIQRLLENPVDIVLPFTRKTTDKALDATFNKAGQKSLNELVMSLLGMISRQHNKQSKSLLVSLYRYFMNK